MTTLNHCARCTRPVDWADIGDTWTRLPDVGIACLACLTTDERVSGLLLSLNASHEAGDWLRVVWSAYRLIDAVLGAAAAELEAVDDLEADDHARLVAAWATLRAGVSAQCGLLGSIVALGSGEQA